MKVRDNDDKRRVVNAIGKWIQFLNAISSVASTSARRLIEAFLHRSLLQGYIVRDLNVPEQTNGRIIGQPYQGESVYGRKAGDWFQIIDHLKKA